jgi:hypothetical protein
VGSKSHQDPLVMGQKSPTLLIDLGSFPRPYRRGSLMRNLSSLFIIVCLEGAAAAADIPDAISACLAKAGSGYEVSHKVTPPYLRGDFDGDGKPDYAVVVARDGAQGVALCRGSAAPPIVLGAGTSFNHMKNLDFRAWRVHVRNSRVARGAGVGRPPVLSGDALLLEWESASAIVYWNGNRFAWYQQGD